MFFSFSCMQSPPTQPMGGWPQVIAGCLAFRIPVPTHPSKHGPEHQHRCCSNKSSLNLGLSKSNRNGFVATSSHAVTLLCHAPEIDVRHSPLHVKMLSSPASSCRALQGVFAQPESDTLFDKEPLTLRGMKKGHEEANTSNILAWSRRDTTTVSVWI